MLSLTLSVVSLDQSRGKEQAEKPAPVPMKTQKPKKLKPAPRKEISDEECFNMSKDKGMSTSQISSMSGMTRSDVKRAITRYKARLEIEELSNAGDPVDDLEDPAGISEALKCDPGNHVFGNDNICILCDKKKGDAV